METQHVTLWPASACVDQERWGPAVIQVGLRFFYSVAKYQVSNPLKLTFLAKIHWAKNEKWKNVLWVETTLYISGRHVSENFCLRLWVRRLFCYFWLRIFGLIFCYISPVIHSYGIESVFFYILSLYTESLWTNMFRKLQVWKWSSVQSKEWTMHLCEWLDRCKLPRRFISHCFILCHSSNCNHMLSFTILLEFLKIYHR